jgi:hypothetical protein
MFKKTYGHFQDGTLDLLLNHLFNDFYGHFQEQTLKLPEGSRAMIKIAGI